MKIASWIVAMIILMCWQQGAIAAEGNPLAGKKLYVPDNQATMWLKSHKAGDLEPTLGRKLTATDINVIRRLAATPQAIWINNEGDLDRLPTILADASSKKQIVLLTLYAIPGRDNGNYSAGGLGGPPEYKAFIEKAAKIIGNNEVAIVLEPDAIGLAPNLTDEVKKKERYEMLAMAVTTLKGQPKCIVLPEVSQWLSPQKAAEGLKLAGGDKADGFCVNTSGYDALESCIAFGTKLSPLSGNKKFVIDTSRNGNGPWKPTDPNEKEAWCNPPGRALGKAPSTSTGNPLVMAYLWVKHPGESDGECRGAPKAGEFWVKNALELSGIVDKK